MTDDRFDLGDYGGEFSAPPWILGHRGTPHEAPENTLSGLRRAVDVGLDGFEYDLRACGSGEAILIHDARLERTTDGEGVLAELGLPELFRIDAGSWFSRRYTGEPLPAFDEALDIAGHPERGYPLHMIELKERGLVAEVASKLAELRPGPQVRIASFMSDVVLEARDAGLPSMLLAVRASEEDRRFVRDERLTSYGVGARGWKTEAGGADWSFTERWAWSVDSPEDLLDACRLPLVGFNTNEPYRALATRALVQLSPLDCGAQGDYPVKPPTLVIEPEALEPQVSMRGEWFGSWFSEAEVRNPFPFPVEVRCGIFIRNGVFDIEGLPVVLELAPGEARNVPFKLSGGSRSPGGDPLFGALFKWKVGLGGSIIRPGGRLLLDAPIRRERQTVADGLVRRLSLVRERPDDPPASMTLRRERGQLMVAIESPGDLADAHTIVHLNGEIARGGRGLRLQLPEGFDQLRGGVPFSCGIEGRRAGEAAMRRWAGGLPEGVRHGLPGRIYPGQRG
ncbi:MAG: glycerophosphoryl diester phosphodiesterase [Chlamydiales bacterium]|jgi:glycerophosphoryl diester phosphodiesterase